MGSSKGKGILPYETKYLDFRVSIKAVLAEFVAMTLFVFIGCGTAVFFSRYSTSNYITLKSTAASEGQVTEVAGSVPAETWQYLVTTQQTQANWGITTALAFGFAIMLLVYSIGHISGGQINCAVSLALTLSGQLGPLQAVANFCAQMVGSILGAGLLYGVVPDASGSSLGSNAINGDFSIGQAFLGEVVMTFTLCFVVMLTATDPRSLAQNIAPFAIGMAVFCAHAVLLPVDGCSINPTRSFGPAVVSGVWTDHWVFWVGPTVGAILSVPVFLLFRLPIDSIKMSALVSDAAAGGAASDKARADLEAAAKAEASG